MEHARLILRRPGFAAGRGRLVREAIAVVLAGLEARGEASVLARRIGGRPGDNGVNGAHTAPDS